MCLFEKYTSNSVDNQIAQYYFDMPKLLILVHVVSSVPNSLNI